MGEVMKASNGNADPKLASKLIQQELNGFLFNERQAMELLSSLNQRKKEVEDEVHDTFKPKWVPIKEVTPKLKKDGF